MEEDNIKVPTEKKGHHPQKENKDPQAGTSRAYKDVEQYHHKNTEKSCLLNATEPPQYFGF